MNIERYIELLRHLKKQKQEDCEVRHGPFKVESDNMTRWVDSDTTTMALKARTPALSYISTSETVVIVLKFFA